MRLGIVDVGTLSLRLDIYEVKAGPESAPELASRYRSMPRLGELFIGTEHPAPAAVDEVLAEFKRVREFSDQHGSEKLYAVGTSALRSSPAAVQLLDKIREQTGIDIRVLSGIEEATLTARGIFANENDLPKEITLADIGGGSTEISFCKGKLIEESRSLDVGVLRAEKEFLRGRRGADGRFPKEVLSGLKQHIDEKLSSLKGAKAGECILGSSGTFRTLERLGVLEEKNPPIITKSMLDEFAHRIGPMTREEMLAIPEIEEARVDVLLPGVLILISLFETLGLDTSRVTHYSLRHGVLGKILAGSW